MGTDHGQNALFFFETMSNVADWIGALSKLIGLLPNFLQAFGF